jgi:hypothetical protein
MYLIGDAFRHRIAGVRVENQDLHRTDLWQTTQNLSDPPSG